MFGFLESNICSSKCVPLSVGKNTIMDMLPNLCQLTGSPRQTNHCVR